MNLSHAQTFELLQKAADRPLSTAQRASLDQHLQACEDCRVEGELLRDLKAEARRGAGELPPRSMDDEDLEAIYTRLHRKQLGQRLWRPLPALGWIAALFLLAFSLNWAIQTLRLPSGAEPTIPSGGPAALPPVSFPEFSLSSAPIRIPFNSSDIAHWLGEHMALVFITTVILIGVIGMIWGTRKPSHRLALGWLLFLQTILFLLFVPLAILSQTDFWGQFWIIVVIFTLPIVIGASVVQIWSTPSLQTRFIALVILGYVAADGLVLWMSDLNNASGSLLFIVVILVLPAVIWQAGDWQSKWRWVKIAGLILLIIPLGIALLLPLYGFFDPPEWLLSFLYAPEYFWPMIGTILAGRLVYDLAVSRALTVKIVVPRLILIAVLLGVMSIFLIRGAISDLTAEDALGAALIAILAINGALLAAIAMTWRLTGWRKLAAPIFMLVVFITIGIAARPYPIDADQLSGQNAATVSQAVIRYQEKNGRYPASLIELIPWYLLTIPQPATRWMQQWCYQGGEEYYRLGVVAQDDPHFPRLYFINRYAEAGTPPAGPWMCDTKLEEIENRTKSKH